MHQQGKRAANHSPVAIFGGLVLFVLAPALGAEFIISAGLCAAVLYVLANKL